MEPLLKKGANVQEVVAAIDKWTVSDVCLLDEIEELSREFPQANDAMLTKLTFGGNANGAEVGLDGLAKSAATIETMEQALRDPTRRVMGKNSSEDGTLKPYSWHFSGSLMINTNPPPPNHQK